MAMKQLFRKLVGRSHRCRVAPIAVTPPKSAHGLHEPRPLSPITITFDENYGSWKIYGSKCKAPLRCGKLMAEEDRTSRSCDRPLYDKMTNPTFDSLPDRDWPFTSVMFSSFPVRSGDGHSRFASCEDGRCGRTGSAATNRSHLRHSIMQNAIFVRFASTAGERLDDDLGNLSPALMNVSRAEVGGVIENVESSQTVSEVFSSAGSGIIGVESSQVVSEVSAVIGDCSYPTAALQLFIESLHLQAGLPWWAAIALTTALIRLATVPVTIYQIKSAARLTLMRPELEKINAEIKDSGYDPRVAADGRQRMTAIFKKHKTSPFSPFIGGFVQAPVFMCFLFAIRNMADRVDSFKTGGCLWFTDLSIADSTYILPLLTSLSVLITVEIGAADGMEGNPVADKMKKFMRIFSIALFPVTINFETALFCYWITSSVWSMLQSTILKIPAVKLALAIPELSRFASVEHVSKSPRTVRRKPHKSSRRR